MQSKKACSENATIVVGLYNILKTAKAARKAKLDYYCPVGTVFYAELRTPYGVVWCMDQFSEEHVSKGAILIAG